MRKQSDSRNARDKKLGRLTLVELRQVAPEVAEVFPLKTFPEAGVEGKRCFWKDAPMGWDENKKTWGYYVEDEDDNGRKVSNVVNWNYPLIRFDVNHKDWL